MKNLLILFILAFSCNCMAGNNEPAHVIITVRCYYLLLAGTMVARAFLCYQMGNRRNFYRAFQCFGQINSLVGKSRMAGK